MERQALQRCLYRSFRISRPDLNNMKQVKRIRVRLYINGPLDRVLRRFELV
jgi:hypothetical protein